MSEQTQSQDSPQSERDIGQAMSSFFPGAVEEEEQPQAEQEEVPAEAEDLEEDIEATDAEAEDEVSEDESAEPDEEEDTSDAPFMTVVVDGVERPIATEEEAIAFARQGLHYTQEMQKLRETERQQAADHEATTAKLRQQEQEYVSALDVLSETFGSVLGDEPDWTALYGEDPEQYAHQRAQWDQLNAIRAERQRIAGERQQQEQKRVQQWAQQEADALRGLKPEWTDQATKQKDFGLMRDYALSIGSTEEELRQIVDHRFWVMLHDAARFRQAQSTGKQRTTKAAKTKTAKPGSGTKSSKGSQHVNKLRKRVAETGDEQAATELLQHMLTTRKKAS